MYSEMRSLHLTHHLKQCPGTNSSCEPVPWSRALTGKWTWHVDIKNQTQDLLTMLLLATKNRCTTSEMFPVDSETMTEHDTGRSCVHRTFMPMKLIWIWKFHLLVCTDCKHWIHAHSSQVQGNGLGNCVQELVKPEYGFTHDFFFSAKTRGAPYISVRDLSDQIYKDTLLHTCCFLFMCRVWTELSFRSACWL